MCRFTAPVFSGWTRSTNSTCPRHTILHTAHAARFISADGSSILIDHDRVRAAVIDRGGFDAALAASAAAAGAEIHAGWRVRQVDVDTNGVSVATAPARLARARVHHCMRRELSIQPAARGIPRLPRLVPHSAQREVTFPSADHVRCISDEPSPLEDLAGWCRFDGRQPYARVGVMCEARPARGIRRTGGVHR